MSIANTFKSMQPDLKETYSDTKKKKRFNRTKTLIQPKGKATAELDASKNPMEWLKGQKNAKIPPKGFAF
jgi:hypothetical protein